MALYEHEDAAMQELNHQRIQQLYPEFTPDWFDDIRTRQIIVSGPVSAFMPLFGSPHVGRFPPIIYLQLKQFGHMLCRAAWRCQHGHQDDVIETNDREFRIDYWPTAPEQQLHVVARAIPKLDGEHVLRFDVVQRSDSGELFVIASGQSIMTVARPPPEEEAPVPIANPPLAEQVPAPQVLEEPMSDPEDVVDQDMAPAAAEDVVNERVVPDEPEDVEDIPQDPVVRQIAPQNEPRLRFDPIAVPFRRRASYERVRNRENQVYRFSFINAEERNPHPARTLRMTLNAYHINPFNVRYDSIPTNTPNRFTYTFQVATLHDARRIEQIMIREGGNRFKLDALERSGPFICQEFPLRKVTKAIALSHRYIDELEDGNVFELVDDRDHMRNALADVSAMEQVMARLSRNGRVEFDAMRREMRQA